MRTLGISAFYHDSAAALTDGARVLYAAEEERFSRIKHDNSFPHLAIRNCLDSLSCTAKDIEHIAYYEKPLLKFERILGNFVETYPHSQSSFIHRLPEWFGEKLAVEHTIRKSLDFTGTISFVPHHTSHASAAFFPSPFERAAVLTVDGIGEYQTTCMWSAEGTTLTPLFSQNFPHSLGLLYATFTAFLGFRINEDEYKMMGLAALGTPRYVEAIRSLMYLKKDGSFRLDLRYFSFRERDAMWSHAFEKIIGHPRRPEDSVTEFHADVAASIQRVTEDIYFSMLNHLHAVDGSENLCISGGVALNALANGKISSRTPYKNIYILGASGDSGAAIGSALFASLTRDMTIPRQEITHLQLGSRYTNDDIERELTAAGVPYIYVGREDEFCEKVAALLAQDKVIGWFQGRMEFGPRALGSRSILANPRFAHMKDKVNKIKGREEFRPFGGSVLAEKLGEFVDTHGAGSNFPFMNFCFAVHDEKRNEIASIVHADGTCRVQTITPGNGRYHTLLKSFAALSGLPFLLNTSFNIAGEPIVENPAQAIRDFKETTLDCLAIGDFLVFREPYTAPDGAASHT